MREIKEGDVVMCKLYRYDSEYVKAKVLSCISGKLYDVEVLLDGKKYFVSSKRVKLTHSFKNKLK